MPAGFRAIDFPSLLLLTPDVALLAYFGGVSSFAQTVYNLLHSYSIACLLGLFALHQHTVIAQRLAIIWIAHIAMDRALGFGLQYPAIFNYTDIQRAANHD